MSTDVTTCPWNQNHTETQCHQLQKEISCKLPYICFSKCVPFALYTVLWSLALNSLVWFFLKEVFPGTGQRTAARWTCRRWRNTSSVGEMLDELEWPSLEVRRDQSSLLLFHKIHCGAVSIEKDTYMTPAHSLKTTRSSHSAQYRRHQTYSDALKNSYFPRTIPHWNGLSPPVANTQSTVV